MQVENSQEQSAVNKEQCMNRSGLELMNTTRWMVNKELECPYKVSIGRIQVFLKAGDYC